VSRGHTTTPVGETFGVEEEYHLVTPGTFELASRPALSDRVLAAPEGTHLKPEMLTSQLEAATDVLTSLDELPAALAGMRAEAAAAAGEVDAVLLATSTHPFAALGEIDVMPRPRYDVLIDRFGAVVHQLNLCGCHVHVSVPDLDTAVVVMTASRPYLPLLAALTASSPYHEGVDTGYDSFRLAQLALWPQGGPPPELGSGDEYDAAVGRLIELGLVDDASAVLWEVRPSARYPTVEFRIADMCPDVNDALLYAALVRSLSRTLAVRGTPAARISDTDLRAARWQASRYGLSGRLWSPAQGRPVAAADAVGHLMSELRPDLEEYGEWDLVSALMARLLASGNSATRQRRSLGMGTDVRAVAAAAVRLTADLGA
jgi:carboxylate-amine ligase